MAVRNVYIFVADALREDHLPDPVKDGGKYVATIAAGTNSPAGFSSIVSGLYPSQHQAQAFTHRLDPSFNYLNAVTDRYDSRFFQVYETELAAVLGTEQTLENPVPDLNDSFVVLERDMTTHAPYGHSSYEEVDVGPQEYFGGKNVDWGRIRSDYRQASERVGERFRERLECLEDHGLLDETLVVFTSDHGELLGEYGEMSHGEPLVPELTRVPTVFRHPDGEEEAPTTDLMSHVDLVPTISDILGEPVPWNTPGGSVYSGEHVPYKICERRSEPHTLEEFSFQNYYEYLVRSVWGPGGGYAFNLTDAWGLAVHAFRQAPLFNPLRGRDAIRSFEALYQHLSPVRKFGEPRFDEVAAREYLQEMDDFSVQLSRTTEELSDSAREELRSLGYL
jgi:hypothetical protein